VAFDRAGMAITLNGIAQGYIADQVAAVLRRNGVRDVLLDLGEARTLGTGPDGRAWRIGIADPADPVRVLGRIDCSDGAVATSGGYGTVFDRDRQYGHLIDPRDGRTAAVARSVTVSAGEATIADAWSTAFALMTADEIRAVAAAVGGLGVHVSQAGSVVHLA
ncbi:MAG TPA: FAD:protein FMN transferase, partial [Geminicoccaceae bacterium]|nr:FAD:protein FMN transferase [Geminicoccaceae bacterium]